jgi:hypothetical protein
MLLLTYSLGFAHNLEPHCSDSSEQNHTHAPTHEHHQHMDHYDGGVSDFLICLVQETGNPEPECSAEHFFTISSNDLFLRDVNKLQAVIVLSIVLNIEVKSTPISKYIKDIGKTYLSPLINDNPFRGPPVFSC